MNYKQLKEIGINIKGIAEALQDTDQKAEINDLYLSLELEFEILKDLMEIKNV